MKHTKFRETILLFWSSLHSLCFTFHSYNEMYILFIPTRIVQKGSFFQSPFKIGRLLYVLPSPAIIISFCRANCWIGRLQPCIMYQDF